MRQNWERLHPRQQQDLIDSTTYLAQKQAGMQPDMDFTVSLDPVPILSEDNPDALMSWLPAELIACQEQVRTASVRRRDADSAMEGVSLAAQANGVSTLGQRVSFAHGVCGLC